MFPANFENSGGEGSEERHDLSTPMTEATSRLGTTPSFDREVASSSTATPSRNDHQSFSAGGSILRRPSGEMSPSVTATPVMDTSKMMFESDCFPTPSAATDETRSVSGSSQSSRSDTQVKNLFNKAYEYLNPGRFFRSIVYLFAERKMMVFFLTHLACTMIIWCKFWMLSIMRK